MVGLLHALLSQDTNILDGPVHIGGDDSLAVAETVVVHRLTGDGAKKDLIAPLWSGNKKLVLNTLNRKIKEAHLQQGEWA